MVVQWDELTAVQKRKLERELTTYFRGGGEQQRTISNKRADDLSEELDLGANTIKRLLQERFEYEEPRDFMFNPEEGIISNYAIGTTAIPSMNFPGSRIRKINSVVNKATNQPLLLTQQGIENDFMDRLTSLKNDNTNWTDEELKIIDNMITVKGGGTGEEEEYSPATEKKIGEFKALKNLIKTISRANALTNEGRQKYYDYWKEVHDDFENFANHLRDIRPFQMDLANIVIEGDIDLGLDDDAMGEFKEAIKNTELPNYVLKIRPFTKKELVDDWKVQELTYEFLKMMGHTIHDSLKIFGAQRDIDAKLYGAKGADLKILESGSLSEEQEGWFDPTVADEEQTEVEEKIAEMEKTDVSVDPIFLLITSGDDITGNYTPEVLAKAKEEIRKSFNLGNAGELMDVMSAALDNEINEWLQNFEETQALGGDYFYIPILDNQEHIDIFTAAGEREIILEVIKFTGDDATIEEKSMENYAKAVNYVNKKTEEFFGNLGKVIGLTGGSKEILNRPRKTQGLGQERGASMIWLGSTHLPLPSKETEVNTKRMRQMDETLDYFESYYTKPLDEMTLLDDKPLFLESRNFAGFPDIISNTLLSRAKKGLRSGKSPTVSEENYQNMITWIKTLQNTADLTYSDELEDLFRLSLDTYINFWAIAVDVNDEDNLLRNIHERITTIFGEALYEIALDTYGDESRFKNRRWSEKPLKHWRDKQESKGYTLESLIGLLDSKEYGEYVERSVSKDNKIATKHKTLVNLLKESAPVLKSEIGQAMLVATDIIRKMKNMKVYNSNMSIYDVDDLETVIKMVKKENGVDIYGVDIHNIVTSQSSFNDIATKHGLADEVIYKIKGMFR